MLYLIITPERDLKTESLKGAIDTLQVLGYYTPAPEKVKKKIETAGAWKDGEQGVAIETVVDPLEVENIAFSEIG